MTAVGAFAYETWWLGLRTIKRFIRVPANSISIIFFPLIQLFVFSQLFKDIVQVPGFGGTGNYLTYLAPGQIAFTSFFAVSWSGFGLLIEYRQGYVDKLRALPIRRGSIIAAELVPLVGEAAVMAGVVLIISLLLGASIATGIPGFLLILLLCGIFGLAWSGTSFIPALTTKSEQATSSLSLVFFPLAFMSTAFVPEALMPGWIQFINDWNPITYLIEAIRPLMTSGYDWGAIGAALLAMGIMGVILQAGTVWAFSRLAR